MQFVATIPLCDKPTPQSVLDIIFPAMQVRLIGITMSQNSDEEYRQHIKELEICLSSLLVIPNVMGWNVAPHIRMAMTAVRQFWSVNWNGDDKEDRKNHMIKEIDALLEFVQIPQALSTPE